MRLVFAALLSIILIPMPEAALACESEMFGAMDGKWRGTGIARLSKNASEETITCQVSIEINEERDRLTSKGKCVSRSIVRKLDGWLACDGRRLSGPFLSVEDVGQVRNADGTIEDDSLHLDILAISRRKISNQRVKTTKNHYQVNAKIENEQLHVEFIAGKDADFQAFSMAMDRKGQQP